MKNKQKKLNIGSYLARYKGWIFVYILLTAIASVCDIFRVILMANAIETITIPDFQKAIYLMLGVIGISIFQRICWYFVNLIYFKYSNRDICSKNR